MFVLGGLARTFAVTIVNPLELVRTKMQSQRMKLTQECNILVIYLTIMALNLIFHINYSYLLITKQCFKHIRPTSPHQTQRFSQSGSIRKDLHNIFEYWFYVDIVDALND